MPNSILRFPAINTRIWSSQIASLVFPIVVLVMAMNYSLSAQGTVISENDTVPHPSAMLDVTSTTKGFLPPRMTAAQVAAIVDPAEGLIVYQTDGATGYYIFENTNWERMIHKASAAVPIGTIIDWWRPDGTHPIPDGYAICNGAEVTDINSPLLGVFLPDLHEKFARGTTDTMDIGSQGGAATHSHFTNPPATATSSSGSHTHLVDPPAVNSSTVSAHTHVVNPASAFTSTTGSHTHAVNPPSTSTSVDAHNHRWSYMNTAEDWYSYNSIGNAQLLVNWGDGIGSDGTGYYPLSLESTYANSFINYTDNDSHAHSLDIGSFSTSASGNHAHSFDVPSTNSSSAGGHNHQVNIASFASSSSGLHTHSVNIGSVQSNTVDHTPKYVGLLKLMRIR